MTEIERLKRLKLALRIVGIIAIFGFYPLTVFWPSGWAWSSGRSEYLEMIIAIYATSGVFLLIASRNPNQHLALISFVIWSFDRRPEKQGMDLALKSTCRMRTCKRWGARLKPSDLETARTHVCWRA